VVDEMTRHLAGKLYADKGDIGHALFTKLWQRGLHLITRIRRTIKNYPIPLADKIMLRKRFVIETVLDTLSPKWGLSIHATGRSSTPWSMSSPASSPTLSDLASLPSR
jgi:hypothetical protein